jgi:hypothetical protein
MLGHILLHFFHIQIVCGFISLMFAKTVTEKTTAKFVYSTFQGSNVKKTQKLPYDFLNTFYTGSNMLIFNRLGFYVNSL